MKILTQATRDACYMSSSLKVSRQQGCHGARRNGHPDVGIQMFSQQDCSHCQSEFHLHLCSPLKTKLFHMVQGQSEEDRYLLFPNISVNFLFYWHKYSKNTSTRNWDTKNRSSKPGTVASLLFTDDNITIFISQELTVGCKNNFVTHQITILASPCNVSRNPDFCIPWNWFGESSFCQVFLTIIANLDIIFVEMVLHNLLPSW